MLRDPRRRPTANHVHVKSRHPRTAEDRQRSLSLIKSMVSCREAFVQGRDLMKKSGQIPTILIVEDIDWIRSGMRRAVERQGYRVAEARNDAEAFGFTELQPVDLILTEE